MKHGTTWAYQNGCRCADCRKAKSDYARARKESLRAVEPPYHGYTGYLEYGCRCATCKDAKGEYGKSWRALKKEGGLPDGDERHGTQYAYLVFGCRCDRCKEAQSFAGLKARRGVGKEDFWRIVQEQEGGCGICRKPVTEYGARFVVDHDHRTGSVRGVLCSRCNTSLGQAGESVDGLRKFLNYLTSR